MNQSPFKYKVGQISLANPIVVASCPATEDVERLLRCADAGAAAAILKSCHTVSVNLKDFGFRRFVDSKRGLWGTSTVGRELLHPDDTCTILSEISQRCDIKIIPSIAGFSLEPTEWIDTLMYLKPYNPVCVQLDLFYICEDLSLSVNQKRLQSLILKLRQKSSIPLLPKLNQDLRPGAALQIFSSTGIVGLSLLDSIRTYFSTNPMYQTPDFPVFKYAKGLNSASLFGSWQLPLVCEYVFKLRQKSSIPILAGGGVSNSIDIIRLLSLGADAVQVATIIIREGPGWIKRTLSEIKSLAIYENDQSTTLPCFTKAGIRIDQSKCVKCGCCAEQLMCNAIEMQAGGPTIDSNKCEGCGFCISLCNAEALYLSSESD